jgi:SAM-dependent methyltransferase
MVNVLEHLDNRVEVLRHVHRVLVPGGRVVILVPQHPGLYGSLDEALEHRLRYRQRDLRGELSEAGLQVERLFDFNRFSVPGWWINGRLLRKRTFSRVQLKALDSLMPLLRRIDRIWPWAGLSLVALGRREP